jgi:hypothetical protein
MNQATKLEAFGFTFYSTVSVDKLENLEKRLNRMYLRERWGETDSEISDVIMLFKKRDEIFDWSKQDIAGNNFGPIFDPSNNRSYVE